jgi:hypothetical protein
VVLLAAVTLVVAVVVVVVLVNAFAGPSVDDYLRKAGMADRQELKIGVFGKTPLIGWAKKPNSTRLSDYEGLTSS